MVVLPRREQPDGHSHSHSHNSQSLFSLSSLYMMSFLGKLKDLGNSILGNFGMSLDQFNFNQNPDGTYSMGAGQAPHGKGGGG